MDLSENQSTPKPDQSLATWDQLRPSLAPQIIETLSASATEGEQGGLSLPNVMKVQAAVVPLLLSHKDVCVKACTGSGKTLAFVVPLVQTLL